MNGAIKSTSKNMFGIKGNGRAQRHIQHETVEVQGICVNNSNAFDTTIYFPFEVGTTLSDSI